MQISQWNDTIFECHVSTLNAMFKHFCYDVCRDGSGGILQIEINKTVECDVGIIKWSI